MNAIAVLLCLFIILHGHSEGRTIFENRSHGIFRDRAQNRGHLIEKFCISQTGANSDDIVQLKSGQLPSSRTAKCLLACLQKFVGLQGPNGAPTLQGIAASFSDLIGTVNPALHEQMMQVMLKCGVEAFFSDTTDECERAYDISSCAVNEGISNIFGNVFGFNSTIS